MTASNEYKPQLLNCQSVEEAASLLRELPRSWKTTHRREYLQGEGVETWLEFEYRTWALGEGLRQALSSRSQWKRSPVLWNSVAQVLADDELRHGRQPFFELLARYGGATYHDALIRGLDDETVQGQAIKALRLARVEGANARISEIQSETKHGWVRREAKKYLEKFPE